MATIPIQHLLDLLKQNTHYSDLAEGTPLYIKFRPESQRVSHSSEEAIDGRIVVIDRDPETNKIVGIEIVG